MTNGVYTTSSVTALSDVTSVGSGAIITDAERTKLNGIEAQADVTDASNVQAAGAVMNSGDETIEGVKTFSSTISGSIDGNASGSSGSCTGNAATATTANKISITENNSTDETVYLTFVDNTSGNRPAEIDSNLKYNPSTGILSSGSFKGNLTGNASGSSGSCTGNSATSTLATTVTITDNENTDEDNAIIFAAGGNVDGGNLGLESDGNLTYNPSTGRISATGFLGTVFTPTQGTIDHDSLANFVANEHIDHSSVSVIAGTGLTGGGTIAVDRTLNVGGGDGITANANDIAITPDQTTITSIYNAGLKIGRDSQNLIDFATTDNKINFRVNDVNDFVMTANSFSPDTSDGAALGSAANMWSDLFLASGSTINFNNGDVTVTHSSNTLTVAGGNLAATISTATQGTIDHDSLANFVANEHIDHSSVSVIAGTGLTGGGTIAVDRTITLNADGTTLSNNVGSGQAGVLKVPNALTAGTNISFNNSGASYDGSTPLVISVDDAFVKNSSDDTMVGTLTLSKISTSNNVLTALILQNSNLISSGGIGLGVDMLFKIENSSGSMETTGGIRSTMIDPTNNTEDACLYFSTMSAGSYSTYLTLDGSTSRINIGDTVNGIYLTKSTGSLINFGNNISLKHSSNTLEMTGASSGGFTCDGDITAFKTSDRRFKDNIVKIENPIEKIKKIGGYNFEWNKLGEKNTINKGKDVGLIAQEIEEVIPEATTIRSNGYKAVQYEKVVPLLIECIKDQQKMIEILQGQVNELKNKII